MKKYLKEWWYVYAIGAFSGLISVIKPDYWWVYIIVFAIVVGIMSGEIYFTKDKKKDDEQPKIFLVNYFCVVLF